VKLFASAAMIAAVVLPGSLVSGTSQAPAGALARGIYLEGADGPAQLEATVTTDVRTSGMVKAMFGGRPSIIYTLPGGAASRRLATAQPSFRLVLTGSAARTLEMAGLEGMEMNMNAPSPIAKQPKEFGLARLTVVGDNRELDAKKNRVELTVEKIGEAVYRLKPAKPLEPGEYSLFFEVGGSATGQLWAFGIEGAQ
jgi:hypothetical protein